MNDNKKIEIISKLNSDGIFELSNMEADISIEVSSPLELIHTYNKDDYSLYIFFNNHHPENEIYQVFEKSLKKRIGWIFPINSLNSKEHDFYNNPHFLKYASVAYKKLLTGLNGETKSPQYDHEKNYVLTDFYAENSVILVLSNSLISELTNFNIRDYYPSLFFYGMGLIEENLMRLRNTDEGNKLIIEKTKEFFKEDIFLHQLFMELLPRSNHHLVRFHLLYQVIELVIEKIFNIEFKKTLSKKEASEITLFEVKDELGQLTNEQNRIKKLFGTYFQFHSQEKQILHDLCNELLANNNLKGYNNINKSLYKVRNLLVHNYRNIDKDSIPIIEEINFNFEIVIVIMLATIEGLDL